MVRGTGFGVYVVRDGDYAHRFVDANGTEIDQGVEQRDFEVVGPWRLGNGQHVAAGKCGNRGGWECDQFDFRLSVLNIM